MNGYTELLKDNGLRTSGAEEVNVVRPMQLGGEPIFCIVIAQDNECTNVCLTEPSKPRKEIQSRLEISQVAIKNVPGEEDKLATLFDGQVDEVLKRLAARLLHPQRSVGSATRPSGNSGKSLTRSTSGV